MLTFQILWIVASSPPSQARSEDPTANREMSRERSFVDPLALKDPFANEPVAASSGEAENELDDGEMPFEIWAGLVPPAHIGYTTRPPLGFREAGNEIRSVTLDNSSECRRYHLRIFIDNQEVRITDGEGEFVAWVEGGRGVPIEARVLAPHERTMHFVDVGRHNLRVERFAGPGGGTDAPLQYVDTCVWPSIDFANAPLGVFRFNAAICKRVGSSF